MRLPTIPLKLKSNKDSNRRKITGQSYKHRCKNHKLNIKRIKLKMDSISCSEMIDRLSRESVSSVRFLIWKSGHILHLSKAQMTNEKA